MFCITVNLILVTFRILRIIIHLLDLWITYLSTLQFIFINENCYMSLQLLMSNCQSYLFEYTVSLEPYPSSLYPVVIQATSVTFTWEKFKLAPGVTATLTGYHYKLYQYLYRSQNPITGMVLGGESTQVVLGHLRPAHTYIFSLAVIVDSIVGEFTPRQTFKTLSSEWKN